MRIKFKNKTGLNERMSNQSAMNTNGLLMRDAFVEDWFELDDYDWNEEETGFQSITSADSFDNHVPPVKLGVKFRR